MNPLGVDVWCMTLPDRAVESTLGLSAAGGGTLCSGDANDTAIAPDSFVASYM